MRSFRAKSIHRSRPGPTGRKGPVGGCPRAWLATFLVAGMVLSFSGFGMYGAGRTNTALILCSMRIRPYQELAKAMEAELPGTKTTTLFLDQNPAARQSILNLAPGMILTVGRKALETAMPLRGDAPLVFTMVLFPQDYEGHDGRLAGVGMIPSPKNQLLILKNGFRMRRVLLFYNPKVTGFLARQFTGSAPDGLDVRAVPVETDAALIDSLAREPSGADGILLIPDPSVLTEQGLSALIRTSYADHVPIVAFAPMYLDLGAAVSLSISHEETARTAVSLAVSLADGQGAQTGRMYYPNRCQIRISKKAANKLALQVDTSALSKYGDVDWSE